MRSFPDRFLPLPVLLLMLVTVAAGCDPTTTAPAGDGRVPKDTGPLPTSCAEAGTRHEGEIQTATWPAADGPHHVARTVTVTDTLTIEAGSLVCGAPGAELTLGLGGTLLAVGTDSLPIVFTAVDSARPWGGITSDPGSHTSVTFGNARLEHARAGVAAGTLMIDRTVIRKIQGTAVRAQPGGLPGVATTLHDVIVEEACLEPQYRFDAAVTGSTNTVLALDAVRILRSGCGGISFYGRHLALLDVRIEGSAGVGLFISPYKGQYPRLTGARSIRIRGGGSQPAAMPGEFAREFFREIPPDSLLGNAIDTLIVYNQIPGGRVSAALPWELQAVDVPVLIDSLVIEPGGSLRVAFSPWEVRFAGPLIAQGTPDAPITITGGRPPPACPSCRLHEVQFAGASGDTTRIAHAHLENLPITVLDQHVLELTDAVVTGGHIRLRSPGSAIRRSTIGAAGVEDLYPDPELDGAVILAATGTMLEDTQITDATGHAVLVAAPDIRIERCEITGAAGDAVRVIEPAGGLQVHASNLFANAGLGVRNGAGSTVDARSNWWGDPAGPNGPEGDGIEGPVDFEPWLTAPAGPGS